MSEQLDLKRIEEILLDCYGIPVRTRNGNDSNGAFFTIFTIRIKDNDSCRSIIKQINYFLSHNILGCDLMPRQKPPVNFLYLSYIIILKIIPYFHVIVKSHRQTISLLGFSPFSISARTATLSP